MSGTTPWLQHYDNGVPATLAPYPRRTLLEYVDDWVRARPTSIALLFKGATMTWRELDRTSDAFASALLTMGVGRGDRVGLLLPNCPQFFVAELGAWKIGAIVAPLNPIYTDRELEEAIRENGVETIVALTRFYDRLKRVQPRTPLKRIIATNIKTYFPFALKILFTLFREKKDGDRITLAAGDHDFSTLRARRAGERPPRAPLDGEDPAVLLMSGGTTGTPKGVLGTHSAYVITGIQVQAWMASILRGGEKTIMLPLPLFHVYGNVG